MKYVDTHGAGMPALGMGTWQLKGNDCRDAVAAALDIGYRHVDTARAYENEVAVGEAIRDSGVARDDIWVTTKVWYENATHDAVLDDAQAALDALGLEHVDLLLFHWPNPDVPLEETIKALATARERGWTRHIGVSNFPSALVAEAAQIAPIFTNQVEYHLRLDQSAVLHAARAHGLCVTAYSPLGQGEVLDGEVVKRIANQHGKTPYQVGLRWLLQQDGVAAIPRSSSRAHLQSNFEVFDFELTPQEMAALHGLGGDHRLVDPSFAPAWD